MDKAVYAGSVASAGVLIVGSIWGPDSTAMWLASTSVVMNIARIVIIALMVGLLLTDPPRRREFRLLLGVVSMAFIGWALARLLSGSDQIIDGLLFLQAGISFGIAAAEGQPLTVAATEVPVKLENLFAHNIATTSNTQGLVIPQVRIAEFTQQAIMMAAIITGALQHNLKPFRSVWRGG